MPGSPPQPRPKVEARNVRDTEPDRTKRFYNNFPNNSTIKSVKTYIETFATWYNILLKTKT